MLLTLLHIFLPLNSRLMPNALPLITLAAKAVAAKLPPIPLFKEIPCELKEQILQQLEISTLFAYWEAHYAEDADLPAMAFHVLMSRIDEKSLQDLFKYFIRNKNFLGLSLDYILSSSIPLLFNPSIHYRLLFAIQLTMGSDVIGADNYKLRLSQFIISKHSYEQSAKFFVHLVLCELADQNEEVRKPLIESLIKAILNQNINQQNSKDHLLLAYYVNERYPDQVTHALLENLKDCLTTLKDVIQFLPYLRLEQYQKIFSELLKMIYGNSIVFPQAAIKVFAALYDYLPENFHQKLINQLFVFVRSSSPNAHVRTSAILGCIALVPHLRENQKRDLIQISLGNKQNVRDVIIEKWPSCFQYLEQEHLELVLNYLLILKAWSINWDALERALKACISLLPYLTEVTLKENVINSCFKFITDNYTSWEITVDACPAIFPYLDEQRQNEIITFVVDAFNTGALLVVFIAILPHLKAEQIDLIVSKLEQFNSVLGLLLRKYEYVLSCLNEQQRKAFLEINFYSKSSDLFNIGMIQVGAILFPYLNEDQRTEILSIVMRPLISWGSVSDQVMVVKIGVELFGYFNKEQRANFLRNVLSVKATVLHLFIGLFPQLTNEERQQIKLASLLEVSEGNTISVCAPYFNLTECLLIGSSIDLNKDVEIARLRLLVLDKFCKVNTKIEVIKRVQEEIVCCHDVHYLQELGSYVCSEPIRTILQETTGSSFFVAQSEEQTAWQYIWKELRAKESEFDLGSAEDKEMEFPTSDTSRCMVM